MKYTVVCGNIVDGFNLTGVFNSAEDAIEHGEDNISQDEWHIMEIVEV